jgi:hypothetical protein
VLADGSAQILAEARAITRPTMSRQAAPGSVIVTAQVFRLRWQHVDDIGPICEPN